MQQLTVQQYSAGVKGMELPPDSQILRCAIKW